VANAVIILVLHQNPWVQTTPIAPPPVPQSLGEAPQKVWVGRLG
jgi:hypothetical protein